MVNKTTVSKIDVLFTLIVGWLGLIIGRFFGERAMEQFEQRQRIGARRADLLIKKYENFREEAIKSLKEKKTL